MNSIRVVVADDHAMVRGAIREILEKVQDIQVVAEAGSGNEALKQVSELAPDVLLLDMRMPELDGIGVIKNLAKQNSPVKVLVLSAYDGTYYIQGALEYGAAGYITKDEGPEVLIEAVRKVAKGERGLFSQKADKAIQETE